MLFKIQDLTIVLLIRDNEYWLIQLLFLQQASE